MIGKIVTLQSTGRLEHTPEASRSVLPCQFGYIEGIMGGDGEDQDAYVLGVDIPLKLLQEK